MEGVVLAIGTMGAFELTGTIDSHGRALARERHWLTGRSGEGRKSSLAAW